MVKREFTAVYQKRGGRYIAWIEEIPGVNTQGGTKKEARNNLKEALSLILNANRKISSEQYAGIMLREPIRVAVPV